jgi:hypothetical protein
LPSCFNIKPFENRTVNQMVLLIENTRKVGHFYKKILKHNYMVSGPEL